MSVDRINTYNFMQVYITKWNKKEIFISNATHSAYFNKIY